MSNNVCSIVFQGFVFCDWDQLDQSFLLYLFIPFSCHCRIVALNTLFSLLQHCCLVYVFFLTVINMNTIRRTQFLKQKTFQPFLLFSFLFFRQFSGVIIFFFFWPEIRWRRFSGVRWRKFLGICFFRHRLHHGSAPKNAQMRQMQEPWRTLLA